MSRPPPSCRTSRAREIENLPVLGRDFTDFINLSGLVSPNPERHHGRAVLDRGAAAVPDQHPDRRRGRQQCLLRREPRRLAHSVRVLARVDPRVPGRHQRVRRRVRQLLRRRGERGDPRWHQRFARVGRYVNYRGDAAHRARASWHVEGADYEVDAVFGQLSGPLKRDRAFFLAFRWMASGGASRRFRCSSERLRAGRGPRECRPCTRQTPAVLERARAMSTA